jgi:hypothetical protein
MLIPRWTRTSGLNAELSPGTDATQRKPCARRHTRAHLRFGQRSYLRGIWSSVEFLPLAFRRVAVGGLKVPPGLSLCPLRHAACAIVSEKNQICGVPLPGPAGQKIGTVGSLRLCLEPFSFAAQSKRPSRRLPKIFISDGTASVVANAASTGSIVRNAGLATQMDLPVRLVRWSRRVCPEGLHCH